MASRTGVTRLLSLSGTPGFTRELRTYSLRCQSTLSLNFGRLTQKQQPVQFVFGEIFFRQGSNSITYSGGQATEGQGGYYGSGGARANAGSNPEDDDSSSAMRKKMIALAHDVELVRTTMIELERLEGLLRDSDGAETSKETIELKHSIKKLMTASDVLESLNNLEINGEPVWGLSTAERELIVAARDKVNEC